MNHQTLDILFTLLLRNIFLNKIMYNLGSIGIVEVQLFGDNHRKMGSN